MENAAVNSLSGRVLLGGFAIGSFVGVYGVWAGPGAAAVVLGMGLCGMACAVIASWATRVDFRRVIAALREEER